MPGAYNSHRRPPQPWGDVELGQALLSEVEELFLQHRVDMVWSGHTHNYQRTCAVARGRCVDINDNGTAPVYVVFGHGGARRAHP